MVGIVTTESSWVVGSMCHCDERDEDGEITCDEHWDIWVAPMGDEIGRFVVATAIADRDVADHIVGLHNAYMAARDD